MASGGGPVSQRNQGSWMTETTQLMTPGQVAQMLQVTVRTVQRLVDTRRIPHVKVGQQNRFVRADIEQWLEHNSRPVQGRSSWPTSKLGS